MTLNISVHNPMAPGPRPRICVVGCGGGGGNAVNNMIQSNLTGVEFVVANTDAQALYQSLAEKRIQLGPEITRGLGAGSRPEVGRDAAEEVIEEIMGNLEGANMVFITAGMGGGTGTGAAPVIARSAREAGILTVGVVTRPFKFEGERRMRQADQGIIELQQYVDTLIVIPNQNLFRMANERTSLQDAFKMADSVLHAGVRSVTDLMMVPGLINLDFADIRTVMDEMGKAMMGTGEATGDRRALEAAEAAINNPLLEDNSMKGARAVLINVTGDQNLGLFEVDAAVNRIYSEVDPNAHIIVGATYDETLDGVIRVSVVATGIESQSAMEPAHYGDNVIIHEKLRGISQNRSFTGPSAPATPAISTANNYTPYAASPSATMMGAHTKESASATQSTAYNTVGNIAIAPHPTPAQSAPKTRANPQQAAPQPNRLPPVNRAGLMQEGMSRPAGTSAARAPAAGTMAQRSSTTPHAASQQPIAAGRPFIAPEPVEVPREPTQLDLAADVTPVQIDPFRQADLENAGRSPPVRTQNTPLPQKQAAPPAAADASSQKVSGPKASGQKASGWGNLLQRMTNLGTSRPGSPPAPSRQQEALAPQPPQARPQAQHASHQSLSLDASDRIVPVGQEDDLEIPTFLRRQAN